MGQTESGHEIHWDSGPKDALTKGPTPMEAVLQAAAVCGGMDVVSILQKRRKEISRFELETEANRRADYPKTFEKLKIIYRLGGDGITLDEIQKAAKLSWEKYCSVVNMMIPNVEVEYLVELLEEKSV